MSRKGAKNAYVDALYMVGIDERSSGARHLERKMIEELKEEKLIEKVGGRFRLSSLIQKRIVALNKGSAAFVSVPKDTPRLQVVIQEILEDRIFLNMDGELVENPSGVLPFGNDGIHPQF